MLTDTHCHLDSDAFDRDRPDVIRRAMDAGVARILVPGLDLRSSRRSIELAAEYSSVYAAVGLHPTELAHDALSSLAELRELARHPRVVAIGEIGLDYYWVSDPAQQARQREILQRQLQLAAELGKPVVLHAREQNDADHGPCFEDLFSLLQEWVAARLATAPPGVLHSFSGSQEIARRGLEMGFYIGVTGPVTYKNAEARRRVVAALPLDRLLIETDAPYLSPHPHRGQRNEPAYVAHIADKIAAVKSRSIEQVASETGDNAALLFSWRETA